MPLAAVTSIIATSQFTSLLGVFSGPLADRWGYRSMMRAGLGMLAGGMLVCGLVPAYWPVFIGLLIAALGKTVFDPAIQAFIGHHVPFERRARVIGIVETGWAGSTLIGIPALALIIEHMGIRVSFYVLAVMGAVSWLVISRLVPPDIVLPKGQQQRISLLKTFAKLLHIRSATGVLAFGFWISLANDSLFVVYGAWFEEAFLVSLVTLGFSTVAIGSAELLGESLTALFTGRLGPKRAVITGIWLVIATYLLLPLISTSLYLAMAGMFFVFMTFEFTIVSSFFLSSELIPEARATMMAGFYAASGIGRMVGVLLGGLIWQVGGITAVSWSSACFSLLGLLSIIWGLRGWNREKNCRNIKTV